MNQKEYDKAVKNNREATSVAVVSTALFILLIGMTCWRQEMTLLEAFMDVIHANAIVSSGGGIWFAILMLPLLVRHPKYSRLRSS